MAGCAAATLPSPSESSSGHAGQRPRPDHVEGSGLFMQGSPGRFDKGRSAQRLSAASAGRADDRCRKFRRQACRKKEVPSMACALAPCAVPAGWALIVSIAVGAASRHFPDWEQATRQSGSPAAGNSEQIGKPLQKAENRPCRSARFARLGRSVATADRWSAPSEAVGRHTRQWHNNSGTRGTTIHRRSRRDPRKQQHAVPLQ
jgi:hypothetical protein